MLIHLFRLKILSVTARYAPPAHEAVLLHQCIPDRRLPVRRSRFSSRGFRWVAFHLIGLPEAKVNRIANAMVQARQNVRYCKECFTLTDNELCPICANTERDHSTIMVVENSRDLAAYAASLCHFITSFLFVTLLLCPYE